MKITVLLVVSALASYLCNTPAAINKTTVPFTGSAEVQVQDSVVLAFCYTCHNPKVASHDEMLAPPLAGIKMQYIRNTGTRDEFIERMSGFVSNPTEENAIMKGPVNRFGLMPKPALSKEQIKEIVEFIYDNDIPQPEWYVDHHRKMHGDQ